MSIVAETIEFLLSAGQTGQTWQVPCQTREKIIPHKGAHTGHTRHGSIKNGVTSEDLYPYRFKLRDGGGTYLTPATTLEEARDELERRYGKDLLLVSK